MLEKLNNKNFIDSFIDENKKALISLNREYSDSDIASMIDHTILKPEATSADVKKICAEALQYKFASVCVNSCYASFVTEQLKGSDVKTCVVVGFPLGAMQTSSKVAEASNAIKDGANEIDMVINIGALKENNYEYLFDDIKSVVEASHNGNAICKVIIEASLLTDEEKVKACFISKESGADFVKTSTGFNGSGATPEDVSLMKRVVGEKVKVKASGGVRSKNDAVKVLNAGADRIGASAGVKIVSGATAEKGDY